MAERLLSKPPVIKFVKALSNNPLSATESAARTCYQPELITEDDMVEKCESSDDGPESQEKFVKDNLYNTGHHTTLEHNVFKFGIEGVSRNLIWSFLHSHPFYNSEQQSQRFAPVDTSQMVVPDVGENIGLFQETLQLQITAFNQINDLLFPLAMEEMFDRYPALAKKAEKKPKTVAKEIGKRSQEIARYAYPIAAKGNLHHTINQMTLQRLKRLENHFDVPLEQRVLVDAIFGALEEKNIHLGNFVEDPIPLEETPEFQMMQSLHHGTETTREFISEFDDSLQGRRSVLEGYYINGERLLADVVRGIFGIPESSLSKRDAIAAVLDPNNNLYHGEKMNVNHHSKLMRALHAINYTFKKKLSHTADSQSQRHRTMPGAYPILGLSIGAEPDVIMPELMEAVPEAKQLYLDTCEQVWKNIDTLKQMGVPEEDLLYLLPNGKAIRKWESGSLHGLLHKQIKRLCYNAQEEIWNITQDEALGIQEVHAEIGKYFGAPCDLRFAGEVTPYCSEGGRYCGVPVWKLDPSERIRLI